MNAAQPLAWLEFFCIEIIDGNSIRSGGDVDRLVASTRLKAAPMPDADAERAPSKRLEAAT